MCRPASPGAETFGLDREGLGIRPPGFSVYPVSSRGRLKPAGGKPVETGWRLFGVVYPALKDRAMTPLRRGKPCKHGFVFELRGIGL